MWEDVGFCSAAHSIKKREKVISEKPYIVMGACLDRKTGPRRVERCEVEDKVLLSFVMEVYENQLAQGSATFCMHNLGMLVNAEHNGGRSQLSARVVECAGQSRGPQIFRLPHPRHIARHSSTTPPTGSSDVSATSAMPGQ